MPKVSSLSDLLYSAPAEADQEVEEAGGEEAETTTRKVPKLSRKRGRPSSAKRTVQEVVPEKRAPRGAEQEHEEDVRETAKSEGVGGLSEKDYQRLLEAFTDRTKELTTGVQRKLEKKLQESEKYQKRLEAEIKRQLSLASRATKWTGMAKALDTSIARSGRGLL